MAEPTARAARRRGARLLAASLALLAVVAAIAALAPGGRAPRAGAAGPPGPARAASAAVPEADGERALALVETLCAFGPRAPGTPGHEKALAFLSARLRATADAVRIDPFAIQAPGGVVVRATNLVAQFRPELADRILVGAHWDTRPRADRDPDPARREEPIVGANDGGSGTALLLALAEAMEKTPPPVGVDLVLFDAEDWGREGDLANYCLGSRRFAASLGSAALPRAALVIDMVGDADLAIRKESVSSTAAPGLVESLWRIARDEGADAFLHERAVQIFDDHVPLIQAGIPAALLIDLEYDAWHTHADLPDKLSAASLAQVGRVVFAWVYSGAP